MRLEIPKPKPAEPERKGPDCRVCRDHGYIPLTRPHASWLSASDLAGALDRGECCLCMCDQGRWWCAWFAELSDPIVDRDGRHIPTGFAMPNQGIPDYGCVA